MFITVLSFVAFASVLSERFHDAIVSYVSPLVKPLRFVGAFALDEAVSWYTMYKASWVHWWMLRERKRKLLLECSKRSRKLIEHIYDDIGETELELLADCKYTRAAIVMSRRARLQLKYPKWSEANELVVADWVKRNFDEGTSYGVRTRMAPLVIKMTFIKSSHEHKADYLPVIFKGAIDVA
jgi:hypothetical protein